METETVSCEELQLLQAAMSDIEARRSDAAPNAISPPPCPPPRKNRSPSSSSFRQSVSSAPYPDPSLLHFPISSPSSFPQRPTTPTTNHSSFHSPQQSSTTS